VKLTALKLFSYEDAMQIGYTELNNRIREIIQDNQNADKEKNNCTLKGNMYKQINPEFPISSIRLSPDKSMIAVAYQSEKFIWSDENENFKIQIFENKTFKLIQELEYHKTNVESIDFSPDSKKIVSADNDGNIVIWNLPNGEKIKKIETGKFINKVKYTGSGEKIIAIQGYDKIAFVFDNTGNLIDKIETGKQINDFAINNNTNEIIFGCYDEIQTYSLFPIKKIKSIPFKDLMTIIFNHDYSKIAIGTTGECDIIMMNSKLKELYRLKGHFKPVLSMSFSFDDTNLVSASSDQTIRLWNLNSKTETFQLSNEHKGIVHAVEFIGNDKFVSGGEKDLKIWE
jgi:WD40 repeat protein